MFEEYENPHNITRTEYRKILYAFNSLLANAIIYEGVTFVLPKGVGTLGVYKKPTTKRGYFDYATFNKTGIKRWIQNHHSGNFRAKVIWNLSVPWCQLPVIVHNMFRFKPARLVNRTLAKAIKEQNTINLYYDY